MITEDDDGIDIRFEVTWGCLLAVLACIAVWAVVIVATARAMGVI